MRERLVWTHKTGNENDKCVLVKYIYMRPFVYNIHCVHMGKKRRKVWTWLLRKFPGTRPGRKMKIEREMGRCMSDGDLTSDKKNTRLHTLDLFLLSYSWGQGFLFFCFCFCFCFSFSLAIQISTVQHHTITYTYYRVNYTNNPWILLKYYCTPSILYNISDLTC